MINDLETAPVIHGPMIPEICIVLIILLIAATHTVIAEAVRTVSSGVSIGATVTTVAGSDIWAHRLWMSLSVLKSQRPTDRTHLARFVGTD
jgi:hypothetical protein